MACQTSRAVTSCNETGGFVILMTKVTLMDGHSLEQCVLHPKGEVENPMTR